MLAGFRRFSEFDASRALADDLGLTFADHEIQEMLEDEGDLALHGALQCMAGSSWRPMTTMTAAWMKTSLCTPCEEPSSFDRL